MGLPAVSFPYRQGLFENLFRVIVRPQMVFAGVQHHPRWFFPLVVLSFSNGIVLSIPQLLLLHPSEFGLTDVLGLSIVSFIRWILASAFLAWLVFLSAGMLNRQENHFTYKEILSTVIFCQMVFVLESTTLSILSLFNGLTGKPVLEARIVGLDILAVLTRLPSTVIMVLQKVIFFTIWFVTILSIGVSIVTGISKMKSIILTVLLWSYCLVMLVLLKVSLLNAVKGLFT